MNKTKTYATIGENVGMGGYDPVSYFLEGGSKPQKGFVLRNHVYDGITYRFATDENLNRFKANPDQYLPLYGGWCAWAIGKLGKKVECDPTSYEIKDGKLYLFYNHAELDTRKDWLANEKELSKKAEENWNSSINQ